MSMKNGKKNSKNIFTAGSTKNNLRYSEALEKYYNSDYKFSKPKISAKNNSLFKKSGRMLKKIYSIDRQIKNTSMVKQAINSGHKKNMSYNYAPRNGGDSGSRSLTANSFMSNRYSRKSISSSKLAKINEQAQSIVYPTSSASKCESRDGIVVDLDFRHSFSHNFDYNKRSPNEKKRSESTDFKGMPLTDSFEYKNVYSIDPSHSKSSMRKSSIDTKNAHKRVVSESMNNYHSKISVVDSHMLRESRKDSKFKKKKFHISGNSQRSDSKTEIARHTPVSKRSDASTNAQNVQLFGIEDNIKRQLKEIEERTVRASTRGKDIKCFDERRLNVFIKSLKDLADNEVIPATLMVLLRDGFED